MDNEKTMAIFKTDAHREEFLRAFKKLTMSGAVTRDAALEKLIRSNPHFFRVPDEDEVKRTFNDVLNSEIRSRALQPTSRHTYDIFRGHTDKQKTS